MIVEKAAVQLAGDHTDTWCAYTAPGHAAMLRIDNHRHTVRLQIIPNALRHLCGKPFLDL